MFAKIFRVRGAQRPGKDGTGLDGTGAEWRTRPQRDKASLGTARYGASFTGCPFLFEPVRLWLILSLLPITSLAEPFSELSLNKWFCNSIGGQTETRHFYTYAGGRSHISVDCETANMVYEGGLDKRSSLDSVQQALFAGYVTGKRPAVVIYNTDGREGRFEYRIKTACQQIGLRYQVYP